MPALLSIHKLLLLSTVATASAATAFIATSAAADPESWEVTCASSTPATDGMMICSDGKMLEVSAPNAEQKMLLRIGAPATHCSDITYVVNRLPGGSTPIAMSRRLAPGEDQILELGNGWAEEGTYITVSAVGHVGGCNTGVLGSWGALSEIYPLP